MTLVRKPARRAAWACPANGHEVGDRGRLPAELTEAYRRATRRAARPDRSRPTAQLLGRASVTGRRGLLVGV